MQTETQLVLLENGREFQRFGASEIKVEGGSLVLPPVTNGGTLTHFRLDYADGTSSPQLTPLQLMPWAMERFFSPDWRGPAQERRPGV